ncbi:MAG: MBL fold metallo-hydrolase [Myxococcaceae bacterium]|nr:MBL fold metallo-hydrolase [Myxococcaceae bacterium]
MKRILLTMLAVVVLLVGVAGGLVGSAFVGLQPATDGPVAPGVQLVRDGYVNAFLIDLDDGVALIDCGNDPEAKSLLAALKDRGLEIASVKAIFLTHGHRDHLGGCRQFPSAAVFAFEGDRGLVEGTKAANGPLPRLAGIDASAAVKVTSALTDGATVSFGSVGVTAWNIPGHTEGSAAFLARGVLFLGDSAAGQSDGAIRPAPWVFSDDVGRCRASLMGLATRAPMQTVAQLAFSHSGWLAGGSALTTFH